MKLKFGILLLACALLGSCGQNGAEEHEVTEVQVPDTLCSCNDILLNTDLNRAFLGESAEPYTGKCQLFYESGQLKVERPYLKGQIDGTVREWYENGQLMSEIEFTSNYQHGYFRQWRDDGRLKYEALYSRGQMDTLLLNDKTLNPDEVHLD